MNYEEGCTHIREWTGVVELECSTKQLVQMQRVVCNVKFELEDLLLFLKHIVISSTSQQRVVDCSFFFFLPTDITKPTTNCANLRLDGILSQRRRVEMSGSLSQITITEAKK